MTNRLPYGESRYRQTYMCLRRTRSRRRRWPTAAGAYPDSTLLPAAPALLGPVGGHVYAHLRAKGRTPPQVRGKGHPMGRFVLNEPPNTQRRSPFKGMHPPSSNPEPTCPKQARSRPLGASALPARNKADARGTKVRSRTPVPTKRGKGLAGTRTTRPIISHGERGGPTPSTTPDYPNFKYGKGRKRGANAQLPDPTVASRED